MGGAAAGLWGALIGFFTIGLAGAFVADYGLRYWRKVDHIMWTRQALREYGVPSVLQQKPSSATEPIEYELVPDKLTLHNEKEKLQQCLDSLDQQLINGRMSEETYKRLYQKYEQRLREMK
jgi:hypothetical protein